MLFTKKWVFLFADYSMTAKKYISINKTSKQTATRDLQELVDKNIFVQKGADQSTSYNLNLE